MCGSTIGISLDQSTVEAVGDLTAGIGEDAKIEISSVAPLRVKISAAARIDGRSELSLAHENLVSEARDQMITKLYTGAYSQEIETLKFGRVIGGLWVRAFGKTPHFRQLPQPRPLTP